MTAASRLVLVTLAAAFLAAVGALSLRPPEPARSPHHQAPAPIPGRSWEYQTCDRASDPKRCGNG